MNCAVVHTHSFAFVLSPPRELCLRRPERRSCAEQESDFCSFAQPCQLSLTLREGSPAPRAVRNGRGSRSLAFLPPPDSFGCHPAWKGHLEWAPPLGETPSSAQPWLLGRPLLPGTASDLSFQRLASQLLTTRRPHGVCVPPLSYACFPPAASLQRIE